MARFGDNVFAEYATNPEDRAISMAMREMFDAAQTPADYNRVNQHANYLYAQEQLPPLLAQEAQRRVMETPGATNQAIPYGVAYDNYAQTAGGYVNDPYYQATSSPQASALQQAILDTVRVPTGGGSYFSGRGDLRQEQLDARSGARQAAVADRGTQAALGMPGFGMGEVNGQQVLYPEAGARNAALRGESLMRAGTDPIDGLPRGLPGDGSGGLIADTLEQMFGADSINKQRQAFLAKQAETDKTASERQHELNIANIKARAHGREGGAPLLTEFENEIARVQKLQKNYDEAAAIAPAIQRLAREDPDRELQIAGKTTTPIEWLREFGAMKRPDLPQYDTFVKAYADAGHPKAKGYSGGGGPGAAGGSDQKVPHKLIQTSAFALVPAETLAKYEGQIPWEQLQKSGFFEAPPEQQKAFLRAKGLLK